MSTPAAPLPPHAAEFLSLAEHRTSLRASIAARDRIAAHQTADFRAVTVNERARLTEIEARLQQLDAAAFAEILDIERTAAAAATAE